MEIIVFLKVGLTLIDLPLFHWVSKHIIPLKMLSLSFHRQFTFIVMDILGLLKYWRYQILSFMPCKSTDKEISWMNVCPYISLSLNTI